MSGENTDSRRVIQTTDREILACRAYSDDRYLAARQALYTWQTPRYDLPSLVIAELNDVTGTVIDVGCGNGKYLMRLAADRPDLRLIGVDVSAGILRGIAATVIVGDVLQLPFQDATASTVLAMHMLYHVDDIIQQKGRFTITCLRGIIICRNNVEE